MSATEPETEPRILIVDDEPDIVENIAEYLTRKGFSVETAMDGADALQHLGDDTARLIVVADIRMPRLDGLALLRTIRESNRNQTRVILISGHAGTTEAEQALNLGAFDFLSKPLKLTDLASVIGSASASLN